MISEETARLLQFIASFDYGMPQNELPDWVNWHDVHDLKKRGFISFSTIVPPNKEKEYPIGLYAAHITTSGRDALYEFQQLQNEKLNQATQYEEEKQNRKQERKQDFRRGLITAIISSICGSLITLFIEHVIIS